MPIGSFNRDHIAEQLAPFKEVNLLLFAIITVEAGAFISSFHVNKPSLKKDSYTTPTVKHLSSLWIAVLIMALTSTTAFVVSTTTRSLQRMRPLTTCVHIRTKGSTPPVSRHLWAAAAVPLRVVDQAAAASGFFSSIRIPAALVVGSSLAAFFTLVDRVQETKIKQQSRLENVVVLLYHVLATMALLLSLNVVVTATATANALMLGFRDPMATSAYALLEREYYFEFLVTRWSFFSSLFAFLGCVATRALIEFDLLNRRRWRSCIFVVSSISALFFHLLSFVNERLECWQNMGRMTLGVLRCYGQRAISGGMLMQSISLLFLCTSIVSFLLVLRRSIHTGMWKASAAPMNDGEDKNANAKSEGPLSNVLSTAEQPGTVDNFDDTNSASDITDQAVT